jgi:hypothetical protein
MAFLDNSGDIILDAVLTDTGRARLARGDGTFRIAKFALGDDEVDYSTYKNDNNADGAHASGSAYYDLEILQTPVLEAFTNNTSTLKSKLLSVPRTNLLYLPVLKLQKTGGSGELSEARWNSTAESFQVFVDKDSVEDLTNQGQLSENGIIDGRTGDGATVAVHQGLDTTEISFRFEMDADLLETQYIIEMDNRLGNIVARNGGTAATLSFIDDDNIASYFLSLGTDTSFVLPRATFGNTDNEVQRGDTTPYPVQGPQGTRLAFSLRSSLETRTSTYLFTKLGVSVANGDDLTGLGSLGLTGQYYYIDSNIRVTGATTGYRIDLPVRFIKKA